MFIRETLTRRVEGKSYRSIRLVESCRVGSKVRQRTLLNLGAGFPIPREQWSELVEIVEARLAGNAPLLEPDPALAVTADTIVQNLRSRSMKLSDADVLNAGMRSQCAPR